MQVNWSMFPRYLCLPGMCASLRGYHRTFTKMPTHSACAFKNALAIPQIKIREPKKKGQRFWFGTFVFFGIPILGFGSVSEVWLPQFKNNLHFGDKSKSLLSPPYSGSPQVTTCPSIRSAAKAPLFPAICWIWCNSSWTCLLLAPESLDQTKNKQISVEKRKLGHSYIYTYTCYMYIYIYMTYMYMQTCLIYIYIIYSAKCV